MNKLKKFWKFGTISTALSILALILLAPTYRTANYMMEHYWYVGNSDGINGYLVKDTDYGHLLFGATEMTCSADELNVLDGLTVSAAEYQFLEGSALTALSGLTISAVEFGYLEDSAVTALVGNSITGTEFAYLNTSGIASIAALTTGQFTILGYLYGSTISSDELGYLEAFVACGTTVTAIAGTTVGATEFAYLNTTGIAQAAGMAATVTSAELNKLDLPAVTSYSLPQVLEVDVTGGTQDGTTIMVGSSITMPAGIFTAGKVIEVECVGEIAGDSQSSIIGISMADGATISSVCDVSVSSAAGSIVIKGYIFEYTDVAHQRCLTSVTYQDGGEGFYLPILSTAETQTVNFATAKTVGVTLDMSTGTGDCELQIFACTWTMKN